MNAIPSLRQNIRAIVIGASAGALDALMEILPKLPTGFKPSVMVVVHIPPDKENILPQLFEKICPLKLCEAGDKQPIEGGSVYFAPPDYHLQVEANNALSLSSEEPVLFSRPSIDVLFETAADVYGPSLIGIVLTGANEDGAKGLRQIINAGGIGLVQSVNSAKCPQMPMAALALNSKAYELTLSDIAEFLKRVDNA